MAAVMDTPDVTRTQAGAGAILLAIVTACLAAGIHGADLIAYLAAGTLATIALVASDVALRKSRAANVDGVLRAKAIAAQSIVDAAATDTDTTTEGE